MGFVMQCSLTGVTLASLAAFFVKETYFLYTILFLVRENTFEFICTPGTDVQEPVRHDPSVNW